MNKSQAFRQGFLTVLPPSIVVWGVAGYYIGGEDGAIAFLVLMAITLTLLVPFVYYAYRRGPQNRQRDRRYHIRGAIGFLVLAVLWALMALLEAKGAWNVAAKAGGAVAWLVVAADHFYRAKKAAAVATNP